MSDTPHIDLNQLNVPDLTAKVREFREGLLLGTDGAAGDVEGIVMAFMQNLLFAQITVMGQQKQGIAINKSALEKAARVLLADFDRGEIIPLSEVGDAVTAVIGFHFDDLRDALGEEGG